MLVFCNAYTKGKEHLASLARKGENSVLWKHCKNKHNETFISFSKLLASNEQPTLVNIGNYAKGLKLSRLSNKHFNINPNINADTKLLSLFVYSSPIPYRKYFLIVSFVSYILHVNMSHSVLQFRHDEISLPKFFL